MKIVSEFKSADKPNDVSFVIRIAFVQDVEAFDLYFRNFGYLDIILEHFDGNIHFILMVKARKDHAKSSLWQKLDNLISIVDLVSYWVYREPIFVLRKLTLDATSPGPVLRMRVDIWTELDWA